MKIEDAKIEMLNELESMGEIDRDSIKPIEEARVEETVEEEKREEVAEEPTTPEVETETTEQEFEENIAMNGTPELKQELDDEIEKQLAQLREGAGADEVLLKTINALEPMLKKQKEVDAFMEGQKAKEQLERDSRVLEDMRNDVQKRYGIELPPVKDKAFKKYIDASMSSNPLDLAVLLYHPDAVIKGKSKNIVKETPSLDASKKIDNENYDAKFEAELKEASEKAGIPIERLRRWRTT